MDYSMVIGSQFLNNRIGTHRDAADEDLFYQAHAFEYFPKSNVHLQGFFRPIGVDVRQPGLDCYHLMTPYKNACGDRSEIFDLGREAAIHCASHRGGLCGTKRMLE